MANVVTAANLLFGAMSIFLSVSGKYVPAAWIIFFSIAFDIADGKIARMGNGFSEFGRQFDSLADLVSFVLAPAVLVWTLNVPSFFLWRVMVCLAVVFCGAFRLARFNTEAEGRQPLFFNGLPTPGFAAPVASIVLVHYRYNLTVQPRIISVIVATLAIMMVSRIKYPTFKDAALLRWKYLPAFAIIPVMLFIIPELSAFVLSFAYVVLIPIIKTRDEKREMREGKG